MNLLGQSVEHKMYGKGIITKLSEDKMVVSFAQNEKKFLYPEAIPQHLTLQDASIQQKLVHINEEREQKNKKKRRELEEENKYKRRLYAMKIMPKSQMAYNISKNDITGLEYIETGHYLSGRMKGKPRIPMNIRPNSAVVLTECASGNEDDRKILGVAMVDERFWGEECRDGLIKLHGKYKLILERTHKISFWDYFDREMFKTRWGSVPIKYFERDTMEKVLYAICHCTGGTKQENEAVAMYQYFCKLNRISEKDESEENFDI